MSEHTRTALVLVLLVIGFVAPFLIGAYSEELLRPIFRTRAPPLALTANLIDQLTTKVDLGTSADSVGADGPAYPWTPSEVSFLLDYRRSLARARLSHKPVLLYFTAVNSIDTRKFEVNVLKSPAVFARLRKFECAAVVLDLVPLPSASEAARIYSQNQKLRAQFFDDQGMRWHQTIAVVRPEFDGTPDSGAKHLLARAWWPNDPETVSRFLDEALTKWFESKK